MSEEEKPPSDAELVEGAEKLEHVETKAAASERKVVLSCTKCGETQDFPVCEECGEPMNLEEDKFSCHDKNVPVPEHCGEKMAPKII